jgi:hypothetical protein
LDVFRAHCVVLAEKDPGMAALFTRWQISHQIFVTGKRGMGYSVRTNLVENVLMSQNF